MKDYMSDEVPMEPLRWGVKLGWGVEIRRQAIRLLHIYKVE
jgi:hypothetical protein